jgi:AraC-like DNA-binding protein
MQPVKVFDSERPFRGVLRRISGHEAELIDHATDALWADRPQTRCSADGCGDISIDLMLDCTDATMSNGQETSVGPADACIIDYARPVEVRRSRHRSLALMLQRKDVIGVLGEDMTTLAGMKLRATGIAALLCMHLRRTADHAARLDPRRQTIAVDAAANLALAALAVERCGTIDADQFGDALHLAAHMTIDRLCTDPQLRPVRVADLIGCSRASLYRLFSARQESLSQAIWQARLGRAREMLADPACVDMFVSQISFRCGFLDAATFSRMFKRRYGMTPSDFREEAQRSAGK